MYDFHTPLYQLTGVGLLELGFGSLLVQDSWIMLQKI